jgi:hypothetical protein
MIVKINLSLLYWVSFLKSEGFCLSDFNGAEDFDIVFLQNLNPVYISDKLHKKRRVIITSESNLGSILSRKNQDIDIDNTNFSCKNFSITNTKDIVSIKIVKRENVTYFFYDKKLKSAFSDARQSIKRISLNDSGSEWCNETLCYTDKRNVKKYMRRILNLASIELDKPLIYLWKYPEKYKNVFNLRIDVDPDRNVNESTAMLRINNTINQSINYVDRITMALNYYKRSSDYDKFSNLFLKGFDIANHNFFHCHFPDKFHSNKNTLFSLKLLKKVFGNISGFISPEYFWYNNLTRIIEKYKYKYASSLGFDYSNYPYRPVISNKIRNYFEIPSQPLVYGKFHQQFGLDHKKIISSYRKMIKVLLSQHDEPCLVYEHPAILGQYPEIFNTIIECGNSPEVLPVTLTEFYQWVDFRETVIDGLFDLSLDSVTFKSNFDIKTKDIDKVSIALEFPNSGLIKIFSLKDFLEKNVDLKSPLCEFHTDRIKSLFGSTLGYDNEKSINIFNSRRHFFKIYNSYRLFYEYKIKNLLPKI